MAEVGPAGEGAAVVTREDGSLSLSDLLLGPVMLPLKGLFFILVVVADMAEKELGDEDHLQQKLLELQLRYEEGELDEASYRLLWRDLAERLARLRGGGEVP